MHRWFVISLLVLSACGDASTAATENGAGSAAGNEEQAPHATLPVETDLGPVVGIHDGDLHIYLGIPYAAPPTGPLRFRPPEEREPWTEELVADTFGPACPQPKESNTDEDCLSLNIWTHADLKMRPVMLFIHGGGHVSGSSQNVQFGMTTPLYDGANLARAGDVAVVTINYRLGALGFYATEALLAEGPVGNQGIRDVIAALEWVQRNIAPFGGDPDNVTVFGESAGAGNTCALLATSAADGLYHRAIIQSGRCVKMASLYQGSLGRAALIERGNAITAAAGCASAPDELKCMRDLAAEEIVQATIDGGGSLLGLPVPDVSPGIDGDLIEQQPIDRVESGGTDVPIVVGSNADELNLILRKDVWTVWGYKKKVKETLGDELGEQVLAVYPASDFDGPKDAWGTLASDIAFVCPALAMAAAASGGAHPSFAYHFTHTAGGVLKIGGAFHGLELSYVFGNLHPWSNPSETDHSVVSAMQRAWSSFAWDGAPDAERPWPAHVPGSTSIWLVADPPSVASEIRAGRCAELEALGLVR